VPLAIAQGLYFLATGLWPLVDVGSFQAVTGPKTESGSSTRWACS